MKQNIVVVDLDGTLCDSAHREHLARAGLWDEFHSLLGNDQPNKPAAELIKILVGSERELVIVGLTGRNERHRNATQDWLLLHDIVLDELLMRPDSNYENDHLLKPRMLCEWIISETGEKEEPLSFVMFVLEDRDKVVEAWRNLGCACWQVKSGGY